MTEIYLLCHVPHKHFHLDEMTLTHKTDFYESKNVRAYLKTRKGVYFKELTGETKKERFLEMLMRNVTEEVNFRH